MVGNRRHFLRNIAFTVAGIMIVLRVGAGKRNARNLNVIGCGPSRADDAGPAGVRGTMGSVQSGNWSDAATWGGKLPGAGDTPVITTGHTVVYDMERTTVAGVLINKDSILSFYSLKSATLQSTANIVVEGILQMQPAEAAVIQTIRFTGIDENKFTGGGMNVLEGDIGLWVMGTGQLQLAGTPKTSWTRAKSDIAAGIASFGVQAAEGWLPGDEISITPTESPVAGAAFATGFDERVIARVSGTTLTLDKGVSRAHPMVNKQWTAEVINLTRNVRIEGTATGRAHVFIRSASKQVVQYTALRYMGPRRDKNNDGVSELVAGRYGIHFHFAADGSRGSLVAGNVIRDTGNHSYVPHVSHGIQFNNNIAYNVTETAFWWDPGDPTHDVLYDNNIVAICKFVPASLNMNAENAPTFSSSGFGLNSGDGNVCKNNVVVAGGQGDFADGGAYNWEAVLNEGVWGFTGNMSHNNDNGLRVWQNSTRNHVIEDFIAYHNGMGIFHGAYGNSYTYNGGILYGNEMQIKAASSNSNRVRVENILIDGAGIIDYGIEVIHSPLPGERPVLIRNVTVRGCKKGALLDSAAPEVHSTDIVQCSFEGAILLHPDAAPGETIRVQPVSGQAFQLSKTGKSYLSPFAASLWGDGKGLIGEYFNSSNFANQVLTRIDSNVSFTEWSTGVHYAITSSVYSVRWTGFIQPQYDESFTFFLGCGGGFRLWVDSKLLMDSWVEHYPDVYRSIPISLKAGEKYSIKLEYFNSDGGTGMGLFWMSDSLPLEYVPQSQLYTERVITPPPPPPPTETKVNGTVVHDYIEVQNTDASGYQLFDALGRLLKRGPLQPGTNHIYISDISKGALFLKLNGIDTAFKLIKI